MASADKQILTYSILGVPAIINDFDISLEVPFGTDVTTLVADFTISDLATIDVVGTPQVSGVTANDFSNPVVYTVTAEDLTTNDYTVTVNVTAASQDKEITSFVIDTVVGLITPNSIQLQFEEGADVTGLTPVIEVSEFATISPASGVAQDFTDDIEYTVTAQDGSTEKYIASVVYLPDHNTVFSVWQSLLTKVPFIEDSAYNKSLASQYTLEAMFDLEGCFNISQDRIYTDRIGNEIYYSVAQKSLIASVIAMQFVYRLIMTNVAGNNQQTDAEGSYIPPSQRFLKRAKAGSVESEFEQFKIKDTAFVGLDTISLLSTLKSEVMRKSGYLGCIYDINDSCELIACGNQNVSLTFGVSG